MELAINAVGENGKFQKIIAIIIIGTSSCTLLLSVSYATLTKLPGFLCRNADDLNQHYYECDFSNEFCSYPRKIDFIKDPNPKRSIYNFAYSFNLFCENAYFIPMYSTLFFFGGILGCVFFSTIPDKYGRKNLFLLLLVCSCFLQINTFFAINPTHLIFIFFFSGLASFAYGMSSVIVAEYIPRSISNIIMSFTNAIYPLSGIGVGLYFYYINNWRLLFFIFSIIEIIVTYLALKYFIESPRWLNSQQLNDKCLECLEQIAIINGNLQQWQTFIKNNKNLLNTDNNNNTSSQNKSQTKNYSIFDIISFKSQRKNFFYNFIVWFSAGFCFYGIILNLGTMGGDFFTDIILAFSGEISSELSSGMLSNIFGRIPIMSGGSLLGGISFLFYIYFESNLLKSILIFFSTFGFAATFNVIFIYTPELFPTPIRGTICGFSYLVSRFGAMIVSPLTSTFGKNVNYLFSIFGILSGIIFFDMDETLGRDILDHIPETEGCTSFVYSSGGQGSDIKFDIVSNAFTKSSIYFKK